MEKELDRLIQQWACQQRSQWSGKPAECGHHIVRRTNKLTRWDINNIMPLTIEEHRRMHDGEGQCETSKQIGYYLDNRESSFKGFLLKNCLTKKEFMLEKKKELEQMI